MALLLCSFLKVDMQGVGWLFDRLPSDPTRVLVREVHTKAAAMNETAVPSVSVARAKVGRGRKANVKKNAKAKGGGAGNGKCLDEVELVWDVPGHGEAALALLLEGPRELDELSRLITIYAPHAASGRAAAPGVQPQAPAHVPAPPARGGATPATAIPAVPSPPPAPELSAPPPYPGIPGPPPAPRIPGPPPAPGQP